LAATSGSRFASSRAGDSAQYFERLAFDSGLLGHGCGGNGCLSERCGVIQSVALERDVCRDRVDPRDHGRVDWCR
jgi:hypothetical protein